MQRKTWLMLLCYVIAFAAGTSAGLVARIPQREDRPSPRSMFGDLDLSDEQKQAMKAIWSTDVRAEMRQLDARRETITQQKEQAILDLLAAEQRTAYERIQAQCDEQLAAVHAERREVFERAHARTRDLLTPQQKEAFDKIVAERRSRHGRDGRDPWRRRRDRPPKDDPPETKEDPRPASDRDD